MTKNVGELINKLNEHLSNNEVKLMKRCTHCEGGFEKHCYVCNDSMKEATDDFLQLIKLAKTIQKKVIDNKPSYPHE